jgi:hypothetical protein
MEPRGREHLELAEIARMMSEDFTAKACRHLAEVCPACGDRLRQVEALMQRFGHWSPEIAVQEGLEADGLFAGLMAEGQDFPAWSARVEQREELQTWGVAWVALERARETFSEGREAAKAQARDLALLAGTIAESLGDLYHPEWVCDLKALAYALAAAAGPPDPGSVGARLKLVAAAVTALDQGTGEPALATEVWGLLAPLLS